MKTLVLIATLLLAPACGFYFGDDDVAAPDADAPDASLDTDADAAAEFDAGEDARPHLDAPDCVCWYCQGDACWCYTGPDPACQTTDAGTAPDSCAECAP